MTTLRLMAIDAICQRGSIRDSDVATLRRAFALDPQLTAGDIEALFRAQNLARVRDPGWSDFFIETLTDFVVRELEPAGYVTASHAGWLIARITQAGSIRSKTEHDLVLNVIDKARWIPESLMAFALGQIRDAVVTGEGPLRAGTGLGPGAITLHEVEQIRALLFAYGNEGPQAITQSEIDILLDIESAIAAAAKTNPVDMTAEFDAWPAQAWRDLIEKATVSAALAASGFGGPSREQILLESRQIFEAPEHRLAYPTDHAAPTALGGMARTPRNCLLSLYKPLGTEARAMLRLELQRIEIITGESVTVADAGRLALRLAEPNLYAGPAAATIARIDAAGLALQTPLAGRASRMSSHAA